MMGDQGNSQISGKRKFLSLKVHNISIKKELILSIFMLLFFISPAWTNEIRKDCAKCHPLIYRQWKQSAHARSASNSMVQTMYSGTHALGFRGWRPGYKLDFPTTSGNCATCHAPTAAFNSPFTTDLSKIDRNDGISCVFCHKIKGIELHPSGKMPGTLSIKIEEGKDKCPRSMPTFLKKSEFCAPCHMAKFWDVPIFNTYLEWRESPYYKKGIQCQDCHMAGSNHKLKGPDDIDFLSQGISLEVKAEIKDIIEVKVAVKNTGAGHNFPTGHPMRNLILLVEAKDEKGNSLPCLSKEKVPDYGEIWSGKPGKGFAMILGEIFHSLCFNTSVKTNNARIGQNADSVIEERKIYAQPFWRHSYIESDNRIAPSASDISKYQFEIPKAKFATVTVTLIYRKAFKPLANWKGWDLKDTIIGKKSLKLYFQNRKF